MNSIINISNHCNAIYFSYYYFLNFVSNLKKKFLTVNRERLYLNIMVSLSIFFVLPRVPMYGSISS